MTNDSGYGNYAVRRRAGKYQDMKVRYARWVGLLVAACAVIVIASCSSGGSSSGSGGGNNQYAGTYSGSHTVNFSGDGVNSSGVVFLTMTVNPNGSYRIVDGIDDPNSIPVTGNLNGNRFSANGSGSGTIDGIRCDITISYNGSIQNNTATGRDTGSGNCRTGGTTVTFSINGTFALPQQSKAGAPKNSSLFDGAAILLEY